MRKKLKIRDGNPAECNHNVDQQSNSLLFVQGFRTMVYPPHLYAVCKQCGQAFEFVQDTKGKIKLLQEED